jgi:hypothetical protein
MRCGRRFGRPRPLRFTAPPAMSCEKTTASCRWPGVSISVSSLPFPSARRCTLVLNPPWLRPHASAVGALFLPPPHAGGRGQWCYPRSGSASRVARRPGKSRQGTPVRTIHRMPFTMHRWSWAGCPVFDCWGGSRGWSRSHCVLVKSPRFIALYKIPSATEFANTP